MRLGRWDATEGSQRRIGLVDRPKASLRPHVAINESAAYSTQRAQESREVSVTLTSAPLGGTATQFSFITSSQQSLQPEYSTLTLLESEKERSITMAPVHLT